MRLHFLYVLVLVCLFWSCGEDDAGPNPPGNVQSRFIGALKALILSAMGKGLRFGLYLNRLFQLQHLPISAKMT